MKACKEISGIATLILNLGCRWSWMVNLTLRPLYTRARTPVGVELEAGWAPDPVWTFRKTIRTKSFLYSIPVKRMQVFFCSSPRPDRLWNPPNVLSCVCWSGLRGVRFPEGEAYLTFLSVPRLRMRVTIPAQLHSCSWCADSITKGINTELPVWFSCVFNLICNGRLERYDLPASRSSC
jgi:hypothetical protein